MPAWLNDMIAVRTVQDTVRAHLFIKQGFEVIVKAGI